MQLNGRSAFLKLLIDEGVTHLFGNPGTTELAIMEVVPNFPELKYVLGLQESIVVGMADGYARASGNLAACNLHTAPGLGHAMGALYNAKFSGSPIIVTAGQYEQGYGLQEPMLYEPLVPLAAPLVKWSVEVQRAEDLPRIVRRAAKVALAPPTGPVFLSLPGDILDAEAEMEFGRQTRIESAVRPTDRVIHSVVSRLLAATSPVIIAGQEIANRNAFEEAGELATLLGAAVYHEPVPFNARFPTEHPLFMGDLTRSQPKVRETLSRHDLIICLGADLLRMSPYSSVDPLPTGTPVVHITERQWELGKNYPTGVAIAADVKETLTAMLPVLRRQVTDAYSAGAEKRRQGFAGQNWSTQRARAREAALAAADATPIDPRYLMLRIAEALPPDAVVVEEAVSNAGHLAAFANIRDPRGFYGLASGGLGFALPGAIGVSLAQPKRPVVAVIGDGSSMYAVQALWTAAHLDAPITYVLLNNGGYRIIKDRLLSMRKSDRYVGMDLTEPSIDFVSIARGFGVAATRVTRGADIAGALHAAIASRKPQLIDVAVA